MAPYGGFANRGYEVPQSKYNSALLKIGRLNESWRMCRVYWRQGDYISLNEELKLIWLELYTDAKPDQKKRIKKFKKVYVKVIKNEKNPRIRADKLFRLLELKWSYLFDIEKEQGLGKSYVDPEEDDW